MSFVHVGQDWYGYGWEVQLLETGFLAIFLCPLLDGRPFPTRPPPLIVIWLFRALIFRIMFGAGMIKIRGDESWRESDRALLSLRDAADPERAEPLVSFSPARRFCAAGHCSIISPNWSRHGLSFGRASRAISPGL